MWQAFLRSAVLTVISTSEGKFNWKQAVTKKPPENKSLVMTINVTFMYSFFFFDGIFGMDKARSGNRRAFKTGRRMNKTREAMYV